MFQQWAQLVGSQLQKLASASHIVAHHRHSLQVGVYTDIVHTCLKKLVYVVCKPRAASRSRGSRYDA